jgi:hypothetical protein
VDIYLWTADDAGLFLDSLKRVTAPGQVRVLDANITHPEHRDSMSPVVQQLENVAITSPTYPPQQAQRSNSISTTHTSNSAAPVAHNAMTPVSPPASPPVEQQQAQQPAAFAPMAYNPAAPAAPEPIAHREKTPPPPDAQTGTGLMAAATHDHGTAAQQQYSNPLQQQFSPQPSGGQFTPGFGPPPHQGVQRTNTFGHSPYSGTPVGAPSFAAPPTDPNAHLYAQQPPTPGLGRQNTLPPSFGPGAPQQQTPSFGPGAVQQQPLSFGPGAPQQIPSFGPHAPPQQFSAAPPQSPGFPPGTPGQPQPYSPSPVNQGHVPSYGQQGYGINNSMHQQMYIPEGGVQQQGGSVPQQGQPGQQPLGGAAAGTFGKLDKGISKFLKKLDKKM